MILKESEIGDQDIIKPVLGNPYKEPGKLLTATGSSYFFIKEITDLDGNPLPLKRENMKGIFQRYEKGLLLFLNGSNYQNAILISNKNLNRVELSKIEITNDSPGFFKKILNPVERKTLLEVHTSFFKTTMYTSFSSFNNLAKYFSFLSDSGKLRVIEP